MSKRPYLLLDQPVKLENLNKNLNQKLLVAVNQLPRSHLTFGTKSALNLLQKFLTTPANPNLQVSIFLDTNKIYDTIAKTFLTILATSDERHLKLVKITRVNGLVEKIVNKFDLKTQACRVIFLRWVNSSYLRNELSYFWLVQKK